MNDDQLTQKFKEAEKARGLGTVLSDGWGSNSVINQDTLWDGNTGKHWERDNNGSNVPAGLWNELR